MHPAKTAEKSIVGIQRKKKRAVFIKKITSGSECGIAILKSDSAKKKAQEVYRLLRRNYDGKVISP